MPGRVWRMLWAVLGVSAACATGGVVVEPFEPQRYDRVAVAVFTRFSRTAPNGFCDSVVRAISRRGYAASRPCSPYVPSTGAGDAEPSDSALAANAAARRLSGLFVVTYVRLDSFTTAGDSLGPYPRTRTETGVQVNLRLVDVERRQTVWRVTLRGTTADVPGVVNDIVKRLPERRS